MPTDQELITETIKLFTANGWEIVTQTTNGIQFHRKPPPDLLLIILGILFLPLCFGLFFLIMAFAQKERVEFVTIDQMRAGQAEAIMKGSSPAKSGKLRR